MTVADEIKRMSDEGLPASVIAERLGISRQRVYFLATRQGITLPRYHAGRQHKGPKPRLLTGGVNVRIDQTTTGAISELLVAADLMARGWAVFMPVIPSKGHDIVAVKDQRIATFEVRSAFRNVSGKLSFSRKADNASEFYALVVTGEAVTYLPDIPA